MGKKITKELELKIIEVYKKGITSKKCSELFGVSTPTVLKYAKKHKVHRNLSESFGITKKVEHDICNLYISGLNAAKIEKITGISDNTILNIISRNNLKRKTKSEAKRKIKINEDYFNIIDTEDKAYFLGLMISDGWIKNHGFGVTLVKTDEHILKEMIEKMEGGKIYYPKINPNGQQMSRLDITSHKLRLALIKLGVVQNKTHFTYFPNIPENLWNHCIRGIFDGDGSVGIYRSPYFNPVFSFVGNYTLIKKIQEILIKECNLNKTAIKSPKQTKNNIVVFQYNGTNNFIKFRDYLYKNATIYLQRKYNKFYVEFEEKLPTKKYGNSYRHS